jgi:hypothetical protein
MGLNKPARTLESKFQVRQMDLKEITRRFDRPTFSTEFPTNSPLAALASSAETGHYYVPKMANLHATDTLALSDHKPRGGCRF